MSYANAREIFPEDILKIIQSYIDGEYIYIPRKEENRIAWGELSRSKEELMIRNSKIFEDYLTGVPVESLSEKYYLSPKSIQRILSQIKKRR
jgi:Mor family transcriptional regulator